MLKNLLIISGRQVIEIVIGINIYIKYVLSGI